MGLPARFVHLLLWVCCFVAVSSHAAESAESTAIGSRCNVSEDYHLELINAAYPACVLDKLSWVEVQFWNDATKETVGLTKNELESLIRATSRRLLPDLEHEVLDPTENLLDLYKKRGTNPHYLQRRGQVSCNIGALHNITTYALVAYCELESYSTMLNPSEPDFSTRVMGMGPRRDLDDTVKEFIRDLIQELSDSFYQQISDAEQIFSSSNTATEN